MNQTIDSSRYKVYNGTYYDKNTSQMLILILEECREKHTRVRIYLGDQETGRDYLEEDDIKGTIGRSMGPVKVPLLVPINDDGGPQLSSESIVKIKQLSNDKVLFQHPFYNLPKITQRKSMLEGYAVEVLVDDEVHARFKTKKAADKWIKDLQ